MGSKRTPQISRCGQLRVVGSLGCGPSCGKLLPFSVELGAGKLSLGSEVSYTIFILLLQRARPDPTDGSCQETDLDLIEGKD